MDKDTIMEKTKKHLWLYFFSPHGDVQEHLTCQQGARQGFHPNTGPVTRGRSMGTENKRPPARKAKHNLSTSALTQADNTDRQREFMFLKSAELHKRYNASGTYKHLTTAQAFLLFFKCLSEHIHTTGILWLVNYIKRVQPRNSGSCQ